MRRFVLKKETHLPQPTLTLDYAGLLNAQQFAAATAGEGLVLVVAGAGTGKTRTLIHRVAYLIETNVPPEQIVLLTFTRRAAQEMLTRATRLLDGRCEQVRGGTFHAFCLTLLRQYAPLLGFERGFTIMDASDASDVVDVLRTAHGLHKTKKRFPRKRTLYNIFSTASNRQLAIPDLLEAKYPQFLIHMDEIEALHTAYGDYKRAHALMDYDDLLHHTLALLEGNETVRQKVAGQCRHVLVDEYQDTNRLQARLVELFASVHHNVMAVGDDAQSIYRFRGADVGNILSFPQTFPGTQVLKLEQNYRSTQPILDLANHVLDQAAQRYDKNLFTEKEGGERPALVRAPDDAWQSRFICQVVLQLREEGHGLNDMAVLFRNGRDSYHLESELDRRRIPYVKFGGLKLTEAAHIKDVMAHLKVAENPSDVVAWNRVLQLLDGIGPRTAQHLIQWIGEANDPYAFEQAYTSERYVERLKGLAVMLRAIRAPELPVAEQVEAVVAYYQPLMRKQFFEDYPKREQDLEHFAGLCQNYASRPDLLAALALDPIDMTALDAEGADKDEPPLVLSTIHSAKGLEFNTVFVIRALDGVLPSVYAIKEDADLDEELRLLYVALTRAEETLFVSYPVVENRRGWGDYFANPSRFLADVPEALLEPWTLVEEDTPPPGALPPPDAPPALPG